MNSDAMTVVSDRLNNVFALLSIPAAQADCMLLLMVESALNTPTELRMKSMITERVIVAIKAAKMRIMTGWYSFW